MKKYQFDREISLYRFGNPIETTAIEKKYMEDKFVEIKKIENIDITSDGKFTLNYKMEEEDLVIGLGQSVKTFNKRGSKVSSFCSDDPSHTPEKDSLYGAHNFLVVTGKNNIGIFVDYPGKVDFDLGYTSMEQLKISINDNNLDLYIINGNSAQEITNSFLSIIGRSYIPPKWAFGYQQCRWSYEDEDAIMEVADNFIKNDIPCDAIYLDIDYMKDFKDFTIDEDSFPQFEKFVGDIRSKGFRLVPIIDAGVKIEDGYSVYEEGVKNNFFSKTKDGEDFVGAVWPGRCHFPDFLNTEARQWFGSKYKVLTDMGIEGFWNDMNEPAIFYTEDGLKKALKCARESEKKNLGVYDFFGLKDSFTNLSNRMEDYQSFYHNYDGQIVRHDKVHNLYGYFMTKSAAEGLEKINDAQRFLLFSRASYVGMHRYSGIWTGDNSSWWQHIEMTMHMLPSINMCGFLYSGPDTGGFSSDVDGQMLIRWNQLGMFTPLYRNHSAMGTRRQEPYAFEDRVTDILRNIINLRYSLIPHMYSEYMKTAIDQKAYIKPLMFEYEDERSRRTNDQLLVGDSLMITPLYQQNAIGRYVYLPEEMLLWRGKKYDDKELEVINAGNHYIDCKLDETIFFIRRNKMVEFAKPAKNVEGQDISKLNLIGFISDKAEHIYYEDDGISKEFEKGNFGELTIKAFIKNDKVVTSICKKGSVKVREINCNWVLPDGRTLEETIIV